jgi:hypothetical protein
VAGKAETTTVADSTTTQATETPAVADAAPTAQPFVKPTPQTPTLHTATFAGDPNAQHATQAVTEDTGKDKADGKVFTQAQIDAMIKERVDRERAKYADYDDLKAKATAADDATRTAAEKQAQRLQQLEQDAAKYAQQNKTLQAENAFLAAASELGLPGDAAYKLADMSKATFGDDGRISNAKELAQAVAQAYPGLVKRTAAANVVNPGRDSESQARTDADKRRELLSGGGGGSFWRSGGVVLPASFTTGE